MRRMFVSPLRYPGGKSKMYSQIEKIILDNNLYKCIYAEPFAGGAGVALLLLQHGIVSSVLINDLDRSIYAFWYSILYRNLEFIDLINSTPVSVSERAIQRRIYDDNLEKGDLLLLGFATFFLNRTSRSGIISGGPIGGPEQRSQYKIDCRFNKEALIDRITNIYNLRKDIEITNLDGAEFIKRSAHTFKGTIFYFIDPPYFVKGKELYMNFLAESDHIVLKNNIDQHLHDIPYIVTYDSVPEIKEIYKDHCIRNYQLVYSVGTKTMGDELLIYKKNLLKVIL